MEDTLKLIERTDRVLRDLEDEEVQRLNTALDSSYLQLERELLAKYPNYTAESQPGLLATQRGVLLTQELSNVLSLVNPNREKEIQGRFERLLQTSSKEGTTLSEELMRLQAGDDFVKATATVPIEAVAFEVRDAIDRLKKHDQKFREDASVIISQGLIQGWGAKRTATQLRQQLGVTKGRAETIARTEVLAAQNSAAQQSFKDNGIQFFQFIATTADERTCPTCLARHGNVYKLGESQPPIHPKCRCFSLPYLPEREADGTQDSEWVKRTKEEAIQQLRESGKELDEGRSPFEKIGGVVAAPKPVWTPGGGWLDKDVERTAQNHALALLVLGLLLAPKPQPPGLPPIIPIPIPIPIPQPPEEDNELLKALVVGAAITGLAIGAYYVTRTRYRQGFKQSAQMAEAMIASLDLEDIADDAEFITLVSGGFGGSEGQSGLKQAKIYQEFLENHQVIGFANPATDRAKSITEDPIGHIATNWGGLLNRAIVEGRNPDAVRMAATAAAYYRKTGKPINLVGYSAGGFVASEAQEILKLMNVPVKVAAVGTPHFGLTDLSKSEMRGFIGDGDVLGSLPIQNRQTIKDIRAHWFSDYSQSEDFQQKMKAWLNDASPRSISTPAEQDWLAREAEKWQEWVEEVTPIGRYKAGYAESAQMAREMSKQFERMAQDIPPDEKNAVDFIAGGFAGQKGTSGLEYAEYFQEFLNDHLVLGVPNPEFDTDIDLQREPIRHLFESYKTILETYLVKGRNPSAVRMAAMAYAYHKQHGKPINLIGYSGGGFIATEAAEILKKMGVPTKTVAMGTPDSFTTDLSPDEHVTFMGKGDMYAGFPLRNAVVLDDVDAHWLNAYLDSPVFIQEIRQFLGVKSKRQYQSPNPTESTIDDDAFVDWVPQLQLLSEDELKLLPAPIARKLLKARKANLMLPAGADPALLEGLPELLALPEAVSQIVGLLEGKPDLKMLPGVKELLALPGVKDQIRGLLKGRPDPKLLPSAKELLALPAVKEVRGLLTGRLEPKMLRGIPEPLLLKGLEPFLMLPAAQDVIKGLLRGELPPLQLPAGIEVNFPQNEQALLLKQTTRQIYQQIRSTQRRFNREAERRIRSELQKISGQDMPPMAKLKAYRQLMYDELRAIATPATQQQAPGTKKPEDLVTFGFAGIQWHVPELKPTSPTLDTLRKLIELNLPDELVQAVDNIFISKQKGAYEEFWRRMLGLPIGPIPATVNFEDSSITAYRGRVKPEDMLRQMGFLLAEQIWGRLEPPRNSEYWLAIANEGRPITTYGFNSTAADFADGVAQFFLDPQRLKRFNPRRYEAIARIVNYRHPESVVPPGPPDTRSPGIITNLRSRNQEIYDQSQQQRQEADAIAQKQRSTKKVQGALTKIQNEGELTAQVQNGYAQLRSQDEALDRLEVEVQGLEQRQAQLLNPLNNPYFTEVPPRLRAANRQLKDVDKQLKAVDKVANAAAKVRANAVELQQTLSDLETRRESLKVSNQGQKVDAAVAQLRSTLQQAEQELTKLPQSPERSQALRDLIRLRAAINSQPGGVSVGQLHRDALLPRIQQISQIADELEGLQSRLTTTRNKLSDLQTRLARLPQKVADLSPDQQAQYGAIKRTRVAQSKLPARVENYRTIRQSYSEQLAERGQNTQKIADDYQGQRQAAVTNVSSIVESRLQRIQDRLTVLNSLRPESVAWLMESRNWTLSDMPDDLAIVLANQPGKTRTEKLKAAADEVYRLVSETAGAAAIIERRLDYPNELADTTLARVQADKQQWERVRDALVSEETLSDEQIKKLLEDPTKIKPIDVIRYGNQLLKDLEQFQADFVTLLLQDDRTDPKTIIDQAELYRQSRDRFSQELTQNRAQIAREIEEALAIANALEQRLQRDKAEPLIYDINGKARTVEEIRAELEQVKAVIKQFTTIREIDANPKVNEYLNPERAGERKQELQAFERRQQRFQELKDQLTVVNREVQKRREAAARGQKRGINTERLEAEQRQILNEIAKLSQEWTNDPGADDGED